METNKVYYALALVAGFAMIGTIMALPLTVASAQQVEERIVPPGSPQFQEIPGEDPLLPPEQDPRVPPFSVPEEIVPADDMTMIIIGIAAAAAVGGGVAVFMKRRGGEQSKRQMTQ